jgi:hypothetical protein
MRRFRSFAKPRRDSRAAPNRTFRTSNRTSDGAPPARRPSAGSRQSIIEASNPMGDLGRRRHLRLDGGSPPRRCQRRRENEKMHRRAGKDHGRMRAGRGARDSLRQLHVKLSFPVSINEPPSRPALASPRPRRGAGLRSANRYWADGRSVLQPAPTATRQAEAKAHANRPHFTRFRRGY